MRSLLLYNMGTPDPRLQRVMETLQFKRAASLASCGLRRSISTLITSTRRAAATPPWRSFWRFVGLVMPEFRGYRPSCCCGY